MAGWDRYIEQRDAWNRTICSNIAIGHTLAIQPSRFYDSLIHDCDHVNRNFVCDFVFFVFVAIALIRLFLSSLSITQFD